MAGKRRLLSGFAIVCGGVLVSAQADAGWWSRAPADFEDCAAAAAKTATSAGDKNTRLAACEAKFAGRRKPGGGYTYYDFMQNRHFDIAGPNPTPQEQKQIDEQYAAYLGDQRHSIIVAAFLQKQQELARAKAGAATAATAVEAGAGNVSLMPRPKAAATPRAAVPPRPRPKGVRHCKDELFSLCQWPRLSSGVQDLKKALFGSFSRRDARS